MAAKKKATRNEPLAISTEVATAGILALLAADREERIASGTNGQVTAKTEVVLAGAGLNPSQISAVTGKQASSVRTTLSRSRKARKKR